MSKCRTYGACSPRILVETAAGILLMAIGLVLGGCGIVLHLCLAQDAVSRDQVVHGGPGSALLFRCRA
jgi:hypothetical protein